MQEALTAGMRIDEGIARAFIHSMGRNGHLDEAQARALPDAHLPCRMVERLCESGSS